MLVQTPSHARSTLMGLQGQPVRVRGKIFTIICSRGFQCIQESTADFFQGTFESN